MMSYHPCALRAGYGILTTRVTSHLENQRDDPHQIKQQSPACLYLQIPAEDSLWYSEFW